MAEDVHHILERIRLSADIFEKARLMKFLKEERSVRVIDMSRELGLQPAYVSHYLRLNKLPEIIVDGYYSRLVSSTHLFIIARLPDFDTMLRVYEHVLANNLTSGQTEEAVREELYGAKTEGERIPHAEVERFIRLLQRDFPDVAVKLVQTRIKSKLILEVKGSMEKTSRIMRRIQSKLAE
jgi:hypothetical protein